MPDTVEGKLSGEGRNPSELELPMGVSSQVPLGISKEFRSDLSGQELCCKHSILKTLWMKRKKLKKKKKQLSGIDIKK